jgi:hypothetical protein
VLVCTLLSSGDRRSRAHCTALWAGQAAWQLAVLSGCGRAPNNNMLLLIIFLQIPEFLFWFKYSRNSINFQNPLKFVHKSEKYKINFIEILLSRSMQ